jgi:hypothetical protein
MDSKRRRREEQIHLLALAYKKNTRWLNSGKLKTASRWHRTIPWRPAAAVQPEQPNTEPSTAARSSQENPTGSSVATTCEATSHVFSCEVNVDEKKIWIEEYSEN